jgi:hypothetical protein
MYRFLLVLHVLSAIALLGPTYLFPALPKLGDTTSVPLLRISQHIERMVIIFVVVQLITGVGLIFTDELQYIRDDFGHYWWLQLSIALFLVAAGIGTGYNAPRVRQALAATEAGDQETAARLMEPVEKITGPVLGVLATVIIVLMVWQPGSGR